MLSKTKRVIFTEKKQNKNKKSHFLQMFCTFSVFCFAFSHIQKFFKKFFLS